MTARQENGHANENRNLFPRRGQREVAGVNYAVRLTGNIRCYPEGTVEVEYRFCSVGRDAYADCGVMVGFDYAWMKGPTVPCGRERR